jgi:2-polyprenyl-3-methyl-5-hydroxy-6-metoxy-1,4-benzoquinol methylase
MVHHTQRDVLHRDDIYYSGPPIEEPGLEMLILLERYLSPGASVVDVGCGGGVYGPPLIANGHSWLGLEVNPICWELIAGRHLPFRKVDVSQSALPCADAEFDAAICIEVLEHISEPDGFLAEISRAVRQRALFSVPNMEVIPYFAAWRVVPWHLLEPDHKNFFTRSSLAQLLARHFSRVEIFSYGGHPLPTPDGIPLHQHLFAVADK